MNWTCFSFTMKFQNGLLYAGMFLLISRYSQSADPMTCYSCDDENFDYYFGATGTCLNPNSSLSKTCYDSSEYCETMFTIQDGVVLEVKRSCQDPDNDQDINSASMPTNPYCMIFDSEYYKDKTVETTCYYPCSGKNCNSQSPSGIIACTNCGAYGSCDYISGSCVCYEGYSGKDCSVKPTPAKPLISCLQCSSESDSDGKCADGTMVSVSCPGSQKYCSTTRTQIYDSVFSVVQTVLTRGCTDDLVAADECAYTNIYNDSPIDDVGYNEYTCYSTCDTNGCNTNTPNGVLDGTEKVSLYCLQCDYPTAEKSCKPPVSPKMCPSSAKYCVSTVTYMLSDKADLNYKTENPEYKLVSMSRGCSSQFLPTECNKVTTSESVTHYTCTESCQADGCNTGWPARPKCIQCTSGAALTDYDKCIENPPQPYSCPHPYQAYCYIYDEGMIKEKQTSLQGYPRRITRGCSYQDRGTQCSSKTVLGKTIQDCNRTCSTDGCNYGNDGQQPRFSKFVSLVWGMVLWMAIAMV